MKCLKTVTQTNKRISNTLEKFEVLREESDKYPQLKEVTIDEMKAFIGLIYFRGLYGQNSHRTNIIFSPKHGSPVFGACMSRNRFEFLQAHICFDDFESPLATVVNMVAMGFIPKLVIYLRWGFLHFVAKIRPVHIG